jgi:holo-[acyl-carrier protein] synthase
VIQLYHGIDIVELAKFKKTFQRHKKFVSDVFTEREQEYCLSMKKPFIPFAGRFAAKEAFLKAIGRGMYGPGIDHIFQEIEIIRHRSGEPRLSLKGWAAKASKKKRIKQLSVSISHSANYAIASVILVGSRNTV